MFCKNRREIKLRICFGLQLYRRNLTSIEYDFFIILASIFHPRDTILGAFWVPFGTLWGTLGTLLVPLGP